MQAVQAALIQGRGWTPQSPGIRRQARHHARLEVAVQVCRIGRRQRAPNIDEIRTVGAGRLDAEGAGAGRSHRPDAFSNCRANQATEVLPLVPVTAPMLAGCAP